MKKILLIGAALWMVSCNNEAVTKSGTNDTANPPDTTGKRLSTDCKPDADYTHWKLNKGIANAMIKAAKSCNDFKIENANWPIQKLIDDAYDFETYDRTWVMAKNLANRAEYASLRCMDPNDERAKVDKHCTQLYAVWEKKPVTATGVARVADTSYFDIITICPPPRGEDCMSFQQYLKSSMYLDSVKAYRARQ